MTERISQNNYKVSPWFVQVWVAWVPWYMDTQVHVFKNLNSLGTLTAVGISTRYTGFKHYNTLKYDGVLRYILLYTLFKL